MAKATKRLTTHWNWVAALLLRLSSVLNVRGPLRTGLEKIVQGMRIRAERYIQMLSLKYRRGSAVSIAEEIEEVGVSRLVLKPFAALYIKLGCMAVIPGGSLFWRRYTRKPRNSLLKTSTKHMDYGTISYCLMRWRLICLVLMASSMCDGDQERSTKISVSCLQSSMVLGMSWSNAAECGRFWSVIFHWGKHEIQHVLWNTAAENDPLPPEAG